MIWGFSDPAIHAKRMEFAELVYKEIQANDLVKRIIENRIDPSKPYDKDAVLAALKSIFGGIQ